MDGKTQVKVWFSADGYRDPDDNLAILVGGAEIRAVSAASPRVSVGGFVYGDTKDGGQYYMLNPAGKAPGAFGSDSRYGSVSGNKQAAGNYAFYKQYGKAALADLGPGWKQFDVLAADNGGRRAWAFDADRPGQITKAALALANDIAASIGKANAAVVYSAGGGANVPAEAIAYLLNRGYEKAALVEHFAVIQHGRSNWASNYEPEARAITRDFTIVISNQNLAKYADGTRGPDLKHAITDPAAIDGSAFGAKFDKALDVAIGAKTFGSLANATFRTTFDASDAGSHAFAVDLDGLRASWDHRMRPGDDLPSGDSWAHRIKGADGARLREIYREFDAKAIAGLLDGRKSPPAAAKMAAASVDEVADKAADTGSAAVQKHAAPFAMDGTPLTQGRASLHALDADGRAAEFGRGNGRIGVASSGDANEIDHKGAGSEAIGFDFGAEADEITFRLAGLGSKGGAREAARLTVYDAGGDVLESQLFRSNGTHVLDLEEGAHYARLEAADWIVGSGSAPAGSEPDFGLVSFHLDYV